MNIGIDLDGVLRDIHTSLCIAWRHKFDIDVSPAEFKAWGVDQYMHLDKVGWTPDQFYDWWFHNEAIYSLSSVVRGSQDGARILAKEHALILVTSQPTDMARQSSMEFVDRYFPAVFSAMFFGSDKSLILLDALIDDGIHNLEGTLPRHKVLFGQPWNRNAPDYLFRATDWPDVMRYFECLKAGWTEV